MINVEVSGCAGVGKSTVSQLIADALRTHGFEVAVNHQDGETEQLVRSNMDSRIPAISGKRAIAITEHQTRLRTSQV